jgi:two-component system CAI-1 autoinducer sensor kinase/phosphatase CqsS
VKKAVHRLFEHYVEYHRHGPLMLRYLSLLGLVFYPAYYVLRFGKSAPVYDDWAIRVVDAVICLFLFMGPRWPQRFRHWYMPYSYAVLIVTLPLTFVFTALKNGGGSTGVGNTLMATFLVILLADWRNMVVILASGFGAGTLLYIATEAAPRVPADYLERLPILLAVVIGGSLFKFALERATAERVRSAYAALAGSIAHEMRNPLARIRHSLAKIQQALPPPTTTGQPQAIGPAQVNALYRHLAESELAVKRGLQVIAMTLDEVSAKPMDSGAFSLLSAAESTRKAMQEYAYESDEDAARVDLQVAGDFIFRGEETAYLFVIFNLLKNAVYYFPMNAGARVTVTVDDTCVRVRDSGPGMAPEVIERVFQAFSSAGKPGGTGLGLPYCRRVIQAFGGTITCRSVQGEFTEFELRLPHVEAAQRQSHRQDLVERARVALQGCSVLVVDDDAAQRLTTGHKLQGLGVAIEQAADGQRALELMARQRFDVVLLDLNMPVVDGYEFAECVRSGQVPGQRDVVIVAYTSDPAHVAALKTRKAGMDAFVGKPASQPELLRAILEGLEHARAARFPAALAGRHIVLADDSAATRKAVGAFLRHAGATVAECEHGEAVVELLRGGERCDAVLLDINMPGMDGLQTAQAVRALGGRMAQLPLVALTAHSDDATMRAAREAGMTEFLVKPVDAATLYEKLAALVSGGVTEAAWAPGPTPSELLLNTERLESYRRIGMLGELLDDYRPGISGLIGKLHKQFAQQDLKACLDTLHALLGMSGEAGAQALYQAVRRVYVPMVESHAWPAQAGWVQQIAALAAETDRALKAYALSASIAQPKQ